MVRTHEDYRITSSQHDLANARDADEAAQPDCKCPACSYGRIGRYRGHGLASIAKLLVLLRGEKENRIPGAAGFALLIQFAEQIQLLTTRIKKLDGEILVCGYDEPEILSREVLQFVLEALTANTRSVGDNDQVVRAACHDMLPRDERS
ncbi:hypothetical protein [Nitrobacter winogradskyi]|uniref:Uncharacterized protein n=1 Tax=Nitrobacter winogradskyi TaxID=913 RepID=A0ACC6AP48_NITWI|nr:hypothetical protein [Nitrobacter winogradskyi]MCP2001204.1 hypothetical protein [Nitrobacter winogradskyi]